MRCENAKKMRFWCKKCVFDAHNAINTLEVSIIIWEEFSKILIFLKMNEFFLKLLFLRICMWGFQKKHYQVLKMFNSKVIAKISNKHKKIIKMTSFLSDFRFMAITFFGITIFFYFQLFVFYLFRASRICDYKVD